MANGMWTRMGAGGTSIIIAPKVVSPELEAKIKECIEAFMLKNKDNADARSLKVVRQHVEKTLSLSLTHHKDLVKRIMHSILQRSSMAADASTIVKEPVWKAEMRSAALIPGLRYLYQIAKAPDVFAICGLDAIQYLCDLAEITAERDVHRTVLVFARQLASQYLDTPVLPEWVPGTAPTPLQVLDCISSAYTFSCCHMQHPRLLELRYFLSNQMTPYTPMDYFGWDPATACAHSDSKQSCYQKLTNALTLTWFAARLDIFIGCTYASVLKWVVTLYPYAPPHELTDREYLDQCYLVARLVLTLTHHGSLQLALDLLPHEYHFMVQHFDTHLARSDVHLLGVFARALKCFQPTPKAVLERAMAFMLCVQQPDGGWRQRETETSEELVHKAAAALFTLSEPRFNGYAPALADASILQHLERLAATEHERRVASAEHLESDLKRSRMKASVREVLAKAATVEAATPLLGADLSRILALLEATTDMKALDEFVALDMLTALNTMRLTVETLKATGLGRSINKLRKHPSEHVANASQALVAKWKKELLG
ncbi:hypothetical protein SDRG_05652 [Saprolegnia diclina VS20]|uniref:Uncharacterized protein n=1 Tax=Saprolegnia diclina (strain VS20) TaxID=1156394 RepID=T0QS36_SAPDV|nr:hypothetical protein SDRG_05652 [Saprolegnia diclina VS20]EQC36820.1 hypothetical protein SDRG_05652 [Saprolegnia diclina VS20]|eukprot:XP_008609601.1 hypothetical protein SDRG_05652 [Saprolegnia diclina VS20]